jgi:hypothetical protein
MTTALQLVVSALAVLGVLFLGLAVLIARHRRALPAATVYGLRLAALGLFFLLLWWALYRDQPLARPEEPGGDPVRVAVLLDRSASMASLTAPGTTRQAVAERLLTRLQAAADAAPDAVKLEVLHFAANLVPAEQADTLLPQATNLNQAFAATLARLPAERLLVISDGNGTDGPVPTYLRQWAANRRLEVATFCPVDPARPLPDLAVLAADAAALNPTTVTVSLAQVGTLAAPATASLLIDGRQVERQPLPASGAEALAFRLPAQAPGWHAYEVRLAAGEPEVTLRNNRYLGVFRTALRHGVLFVYGAPRVENLHLTRLLRQTYAERFSTMSVRDPALAQVTPAAYQLVVLADVALVSLPATLRQALAAGSVPYLVLTGAQTGDVTQAGLPHLPVMAWQPELKLRELHQAEGIVRVGLGNDVPLFLSPRFDQLTLNLLARPRLAPRAVEVLAVDAAGQRYPLLLADQLAAPTAVVMLADTTWKWALSPVAEQRYQYRLFWNTLFAWLVDDEATRHQLVLETAPAADGQPATELTVAPRQLELLPALRQVAIAIAAAEATETVAPTRGAEGFTYRLPHPAELPALLWLHATAQYQDDAWQSARRPLVVTAPQAEFVPVAAQPARLALLASNPELAFTQPGAEALVQRLLRPREGHLPPAQARERRTREELLIAAAIVLLLAGEWWLERRLKERP